MCSQTDREPSVSRWQPRIDQQPGMIIAGLVRAFGLALLIAVIAGCQPIGQWYRHGYRVGPDYETPDAPVAVEWIDVQDQSSSDDEMLIQAWWLQFNDPILSGLIELSSNQNLSLKAAAARIAQAKSLRRVAAGGWFPQQQQAVGSVLQNQQSSMAYAPLPLPSQSFSQWDAGLGMAWELDFWGRFRRGIEAADAEVDASIDDYSCVRVLLLAEVAESYVDLRTASERLRLARQNIESQRSVYDIIVKRTKLGAATELDRRQAELNLRQTESSIPEFEELQRIANNRLCLLLGFAPTDFMSHFESDRIPVGAESLSCGVPADLLRRRPDVRKAERLLAAQSARIGIVQSELYPHLQLHGNIGWQAGSFGDLFQSSQSLTGLLGPSVRWNVLNYGRINALTQAEYERYDQLLLEYQQTVLQAQEEVENGLVRTVKARQRRDLVELSVVAAEESEKIALIQYEAGSVDYNRVFAIQSAKFIHQDELARLQGSVAHQLIATYRALGGGWQIDSNESSATALISDPSQSRGT